jgi:pyruvate dehydrogenase E2 component (dihydrolipoamide acetyltransferase)
MAVEIKLPEVSEGVASVDVAEVLVSEGDTIQPGQNVVAIETDKAAVEVPSDVGGKVIKVHVAAGDTAQVGQVLVTIEESADAASGAPKKDDGGKPEAKPQAKPAAESKPQGDPASRMEQPEPASPPKQRGEPSPPAVVASGTDLGPSELAPAVATQQETAIARGNGSGAVPPPAAPSTRRLARELNVDLHQVPGSGAGGRITRDDVKAFVRQLSTTLTRTTAAVGGAMGGGELAEMPDFRKFGPIHRQAMNKIAKTSAARLSLAWRMIPHVTQHEEADITDLEAARKAFLGGPGKKGPKITMTAIVIKASVAALRAFPNFNSSLDAASNELILKDYYHIGVAVDTEAGLLVPVIRDADRKNILEIAAELTDIADRARDGKLGLADMQGGTFTITNLGGIGGTSFTPIVNYPEVAILGLSRGQSRLEIRGGEIVERLKLPLSLSYDHRAVNGADAARFMRKVSETLSDFMALMVEC